MKVYSTRTTYAPNGEVFAEPINPFLTWFESIDEAMQSMIARHGFQLATETQVVKVDAFGYMDVVTYSEEMQDE